MEESYYQLKVSLDKIQPNIWRRLIISENTSLYELHHIIQISFGWDNYHLYLFKQNRILWGNKAQWDDDDPAFELNNDKRTRIKDIIQDKTQSLQYQYDMGDSWSHTIKLEKFLEKDKLITIPFCAAGARNCPPEDCGGVPGYYNLIETLDHPKSRKYKELIEWLGYKYEPELLDLDEINRTLRNLKKYIKEYEE